jgi:hypothetical protein
MRDWLPDALLLPDNAITSENWGFYGVYSGFSADWNDAVLRENSCTDFSKKKVSRFFFKVQKHFPGFPGSRQNNFENLK